MSDTLTDAPSIASWAALAVLAGLIAASATAARRRPQEPQTARVSEQLLDRFAQVGALLAAVPGTIALFSGASWQTVLWWWLLGFSALAVVGVIVGSLIGLARRWPRLRREIQPQERRAVIGVIALMLASAVAIPAALVLLTALGVQAMVAIALSLALGYGLWQIAYAITSRARRMYEAAG